jgi:hypothetical protein
VLEWFCVFSLANTLTRPTTDWEENRSGVRVGVNTRVISAMLLVVVTVFVACLLLLGGDVEVNPGPSTESDLNAEKSGLAQSDSSVILCALESAVKRLENKQDSSTARLEKNMNDMKQTLAAHLRKVEEEQQELYDQIGNLQEQCYELQKENGQLLSKIDSLENHSRRNNLLFFGIEKGDRESWDTCEQKVLEVICEGMGIEEDIHIERAHRSGPNAIVVKLLSFKQKALILSKCRNLKDSEQFSNVFVREDFSANVRLKRKMLRVKANELNSDGVRSRLRFDKLFADNGVFIYDTDRAEVVQIDRWQQNDVHEVMEEAVGQQNDGQDVLEGAVGQQSDVHDVLEGAVGQQNDVHDVLERAVGGESAAESHDDDNDWGLFDTPPCNIDSHTEHEHNSPAQKEHEHAHREERPKINTPDPTLRQSALSSAGGHRRPLGKAGAGSRSRPAAAMRVARPGGHQTAASNRSPFNLRQRQNTQPQNTNQLTLNKKLGLQRATDRQTNNKTSVRQETERGRNGRGDSKIK